MADHVSEKEIAEAVKVYEGECNRGAAQGKKATWKSGSITPIQRVSPIMSLP